MILTPILALANMQYVEATGIMYGTVHIRAIGDTGRELFEKNQKSTTYREEKLNAEFDLTFGKDSKGQPTATITASSYEHTIEYDRVMEDPQGTYKTTTEIRLDKPEIKLNATMQIAMVKDVRRLSFSFSEPYANIKGTVTTESAYGLGKPTTVKTPIGDKIARLPLVLDWTKAHWSSNFKGSLVMQQDHYYIDPCSKSPWLLISEEWSLSPFPQ